MLKQTKLSLRQNAKHCASSGTGGSGEVGGVFRQEPPGNKAGREQSLGDGREPFHWDGGLNPEALTRRVKETNI